MKNITLSVPDDVYRTARIGAAERGRSLSGLVADYLSTLSQLDAEFERLEAQQRLVQNQIGRFAARTRLDRDDVHVRAIR